MDKLKTKLLFISLIMLALVSVSAVAAADVDSVDDVIADTQDDFDLSEETVSDVEVANDNPQESDVLSAASTDEDQLKAEGDSTVTVNVEYRDSNGDITTGQLSGVATSNKDWTLKFSDLKSAFGSNVYTEGDYSYKFDHFEDENGNTVTKNRYFSATGSDYSVDYKVVYTAIRNSRVTLFFEVMTENGPIKNEYGSDLLDFNHYQWSVGPKKYANQIAGYESCDYEGYHYTFDHWQDEDGSIPDWIRLKRSDEGDYNRTITAIYNKEKIGSLRVNYIDTISNGGGGMNYTEHATDYKHTFKTPADIPSGAVFLYWQNENGTTYNPGDELEIKYSEFAGIDKVVNVYAVYNINTTIELEEITGYFGDVVEITAKITEDLNNEAVPGGYATLTIDFTTKLSNGLLGAGTYTDRVEVVDGQAVFKDIKLDATPGTYSYKVEYEGYHYDQLDEGINDYLTSEADSKVNILPLNTTTTADDVSGTAGDKTDITADIVDQNGDPVQNGTAVLKVNGKEYTAEVVNGTAVFKDVELPDESTEATIEYLGNDYYNPSNITIQITVTQPEEPEEPTDEPTDEPVDEPEEEPSAPTAEKAVPVVPAAGNPIALVVLALLTLVSTVSLGRKK